MLLLSSPRCARAARASPLLLAAVLLHVAAAIHKAAPRCPRIDCAKAGRHFCAPLSPECGSCLPPLVEDDEGLCVTRRRRHQQPGKVYHDLDEEIDFLHSVIQKQQESQVQPGHKHSNQFTSLSFQSDVRATQPHPPPAPHVQTSTSAPVNGTPAPPTPGPAPTRSPVTGVGSRVGPMVSPTVSRDKVIVIMVSVCVVVGTVAVLLAAVCAVKSQRDSRLAQKVDYPAFGGATVAPMKVNGCPLDHTLAQNAQMFHYQHQKQQMLSLGKQKAEPKAADADATSDEEEVGGDFTVYECPGLAPTGEMEVKNPLFDDSLPYPSHHK